MIGKLLKRCTYTAIKLPFAAAWDCISLGNMGERSSVAEAIREHKARALLDTQEEILRRRNRMLRGE